MGKDLFEELADSSKVGGERIIHTHLQNYGAIISHIKQAATSASIQTYDLNLASKLIKLSCVFNDVTTLSLTLGHPCITILFKEALKDYFDIDDLKLSVSKNRIEKLNFDINEAIKFPAILSRGDEEMIRFSHSLSDLVKSGKVIHYPLRVIYCMAEKSKKKGIEIWEVDHDSLLKHWTVGLNEKKISPPIVTNKDDLIGFKELFEIKIPYIESFDFSDLNKIIDDEQDHIHKFKDALIKTIKEVQKEPKEHRIELINDTLKLEVDNIERRFKKARNRHRQIRVNSVVTFLAVSFGAYHSLNNNILLAANFVGALGSASSAISSFAAKIDDIEEEPFYFLWKCKI